MIPPHHHHYITDIACWPIIRTEQTIDQNIEATVYQNKMLIPTHSPTHTLSFAGK